MDKLCDGLRQGVFIFKMSVEGGYTDAAQFGNLCNRNVIASTGLDELRCDRDSAVS